MNKLALGLVVAVGLLLYLRSPIDLIPDRIGAAGFLDDLIALAVGIWWYWKRLPMLRAAGGAGGGASSAQSEAGTWSSTGRFDPYEVLGVSRGASQKEIREAYHDCLRQYHPDRVDDLGEDLRKLAHEKTLDIRKAYDELKRG